MRTTFKGMNFSFHLKSNGVTQGKAAELLGVSRETVSKWCSGRATPSDDHRKEISAKLGYEWNPPETAVLHVDFGKEAWKLDQIVAYARKREMDVDDLVHECVTDNIEAFEGSPSEACSELRPRDGTYQLGPRCGTPGAREWKDTEYLLVVKLDLEGLDTLQELAVQSGHMSPSEWVRRIIQEEGAFPDYLKRAHRRGVRKERGYDAIEPLPADVVAIAERPNDGGPLALTADDPEDEIEYE